MTKSLIGALIALMVVVVAPDSSAQTAPSRTRVTLTELVLRDGTRLFGTITRQDAEEIELRTKSGATVTARRSEIASLREVKGEVVDGAFLPPDPNATRLFFGPTGRSLPRGQTYMGVYEFIMPFVQVGVTDRLSIGGGTPLVIGLEDWNRPFWVTPKLQLADTGRTQVSIGAFHVLDTSSSGGGVGYVVGTHGDGSGSFTVGAGLAYGTGGGRAGIVMVGGERQVGRNLKLITENYVSGHGNGITTAGVRLFGERLSADLALAVPIGTDQTFAFPVVNFVYVF
jgi:hypothetical protein